jgi:hypothetical protein
MYRGHPRVVFSFTIEDERIVRLDLIGDPARLERMEVEVLTGRRRSGGMREGREASR